MGLLHYFTIMVGVFTFRVASSTAIAGNDKNKVFILFVYLLFFILILN